MTTAHDETPAGAHEVTSDDVTSDEVASQEARPEEEAVLVLEESPDPDSVLPVWEPTGNPDVDAALEPLHALQGSDVAEHAAVYEGIERSLRGVLDGLSAEDEPA